MSSEVFIFFKLAILAFRTATAASRLFSALTYSAQWASELEAAGEAGGGAGEGCGGEREGGGGKVGKRDACRSKTESRDRSGDQETSKSNIRHGKDSSLKERGGITPESPRRRARSQARECEVCTWPCKRHEGEDGLCE